jgi:ATP-dependent helicase Lhr and Lhr-like helicase
LGNVAAIVLDEIHLFDATPRGDHLRCLLKRIDHIRHYRAQALGQEAVPPLQRVALSATVSDPTAMAQRYLVVPSRDIQAEPDPIAIIQIAGGRTRAGTLQQMSNLDDLISVLSLQMTGQSQMRKALVFCNARHEVEQAAAYLRGHLPFEAAIFVHYSNLDPALRRQVEDGLAQASTAICVCTSTLELGIDIGSIDFVVLVGPPPSPAAFMQRIGRAGRRRRKATVVGLARSPLEEICFQALFYLAQPREQTNSDLATHHAFCLSVLVQQTFSILKQSPTGGIRLADLRRVVPDVLNVDGTVGNPGANTVDDQALLRLLNHLVASRYLKHGRAGEWRAGPALDELVDAHEIYSNIGTDLLSILVVDAYTGQALAQIERSRAYGDTLLISRWILI